MKLPVLSDLHVELIPGGKLDIADADVVVRSGDSYRGTHGLGFRDVKNAREIAT